MNITFYWSSLQCLFKKVLTKALYLGKNQRFTTSIVFTHNQFYYMFLFQVATIFIGCLLLRKSFVKKVKYSGKIYFKILCKEL